MQITEQMEKAGGAALIAYLKRNPDYDDVPIGPYQARDIAILIFGAMDALRAEPGATPALPRA